MRLNYRQSLPGEIYSTSIYVFEFDHIITLNYFRIRVDPHSPLYYFQLSWSKAQDLLTFTSIRSTNRPHFTVFNKMV